MRKDLTQKGLEHISAASGKIIPAKSISFDSLCTSCSFKCRSNFSDNDIKKIHENLYSLNRQDKLVFLLNFTERIKSGQTKTKKHFFSFRYYLGKHDTLKIRVCKVFFLNTLCISQKPVYNVHLNKNPISLTPPNENRGVKTKNRISDSDRMYAIQHIGKFPTTASHYCRADSNKQYLESNLNVNKMYKMYITQCLSDNQTPVSMYFYRFLFTTEYNLAFYTPKKDLCDVCEEFNTLKKQYNTLTKEKQIIFDNHFTKKQNMRNEREKDRNNKINTTAVICFDLENVLPLPKTNVGSAFYKRKLNMYNMTVHLQIMSHSQVYCALWHEGIVGRSGNDMASAVIKVFETIFEQNPTITNIITWSDSCVPQNRNSIMTSAMLSFLMKNPTIESINMKFSTPGHSGVQVVDNVHSQIQKYFKNIEIWSPISLTKAMQQVNYKNPFQVIELNINDFKNFHALTKLFKFNTIPFASVSQLMFTQHSLNNIKYKTCHGQLEFIDKCICESSDALLILINPKVACITKELQVEKINDIKSLYKFMPEEDLQFFIDLFRV